MTDALRSELLKVRTLSIWWTTGLGLVAVTLLALAFHALVLPGLLEGQDLTAEAPGRTEEVFTAGQYFGLLLTMVFGTLLVTGEYAHQTATATFLATPRRSRVVLAKIFAGITYAVLFFLLTTVLAVSIGSLLLTNLNVPLSEGLPHGFGAVGLNGLAYVVWVVFGIGLGTLIRSQVLAVVTAILLYLGELGSLLVFPRLADALGQDWVRDLPHWLPGGASRAMTSLGTLEGAPPWWAAGLALLGYGLIATAVGTVLTTERDIT